MAHEPWRRPGFTIPGHAAAAARKGHEMRVLPEWTPEQAREMSRRALEARRERREHQGFQTASA